jgi:hypothetical protein
VAFASALQRALLRADARRRDARTRVEQGYPMEARRRALTDALLALRAA